MTSGLGNIEPSLVIDDQTIELKPMGEMID